MKTLTLDLTERERRDLIAMVHAYDTGFPAADRTGDFILNQRSKDVSRRFHEIAKRITGALTERDTITCRAAMTAIELWFERLETYVADENSEYWRGYPDAQHEILLSARELMKSLEAIR